MPKHTPKVEVPGQATREELTNFAASLRRLATYLETTDAPIRDSDLVVSITATDSRYMFGADEQARTVFESQPRTLVRAIGGRVEKKQNGEEMVLERRFDHGDQYAYVGSVRLRWIIARDAVCVAKPTGEFQEVKLYGEYTDPDAAATLKAALDGLTKREMKPVIEYDCEPILGKDEVAA